MKFSKVTTLLAGTLLMTACSTMNTNLESKMTLSNKEKAVALLNAIETGDQKAIAYVNAEKYTQHNLAVADGLAGFGELLQSLPKGSAKVHVVRAFEDGNYVFTQTDYNFFGPKVGFDVFKFEEGKIVEHWDNLAEKLDKANPSGRTQLDGSTDIKDVEKTEQNKALVANFIKTILVHGQYDKLGQFFDGDHYIQHNTNVADGLSGLNAALKAMAKQGIKMEYSITHKVLGEGNFVLAISEGKFANQATAYYDLFRVENNKIVEHWDVIEPILPKEQWKNNNGKFGNL